MHLLPQTLRGTWLLTGIVWVAGCWLIWLALPIQPRVQWADDGVKYPVGFAPARRAFITQSYHWNQAQPTNKDHFCGPLRFWEVDTGRVTEWFDANEELVSSTLSPDGRWLALHHGSDGSYRFQLFDTFTGKVRSDLPFQGVQSIPGMIRFSPDSQRLAYSEQLSGHEGCVHVWDIADEKERCILRMADGLLPFEVFVQLGFSPNGQTLAVGHIADAALATAGPGRTQVAQQIQLWDMDTPRLTRTLTGPISDGCLWLLDMPVFHFSADGSHLATTFRDYALPNHPMEVLCWDVRTGAEQFRCGGGVLAADGDRFWLIKPPMVSIPCEARTFTGVVEDVPPIEGPEVDSSSRPLHGFAPNGRTQLVSSHVSDPIADWVTAQGLSWPFRRRDANQMRLVDIKTGKVLAYLSRELGESTFGLMRYGTRFSLDGELLAVADSRALVIWDIPPCKPLARFLIGAALWAVPLLWLARRRSRRMRLSAIPTEAPGQEKR